MGKRLIMVGIDGCHQATLYGLIDRGEAPFLKKLVDNGTRVRRAVTMFPSTTVCCCSTLYTGCWYRNHGILNNEWMDRFSSPIQGKSYIAGLHYALASLDKKLFGLPTIILPDLKLGGTVNNDLQAPTIYDEFTRAGKTSYTFFHYIGKGATRWVRPGRMDMIRYGLVEQYGKPYQMYEKHMVTKAIKHCKSAMPDLLSIYFGGNDGHGHRYGVEGQMSYLRDFVEPELARLGAWLEKALPGEEIYWAIVADHGQSTLTEEDKSRCVWYDTFRPMFEQAGFQSFERGLSDKSLDNYEVVASLGTGASIGFYVRDRKTQDWKTQPDFEADLVPALNNFLKASDVLSPFGDWQFPDCVDFLLTRKNFDDPYSVYTNQPPHNGTGRLVPLEEYFAGKGPEYLRPVERIHNLDHRKGPDIVLVLNYRKHFNVNEPGAFHPGQHGSLLEEDSLVPMIFSGPGIKHAEIAEALTIDFSPTAASILGVDMPRADGKPLPIF